MHIVPVNAYLLKIIIVPLNFVCRCFMYTETTGAAIVRVFPHALLLESCILIVEMCDTNQINIPH